MEYDPSQQQAISAALSGKDSIITGGAGTGKCLGFGTKVLMFDGTVQSVEDIIPGNLLMGPDSRPRRVCSITYGAGQMFRIKPVKGDSFTCNADHILSVKHTKKKLSKYVTNSMRPFNISVRDAMEMNPTHREGLKAWRTGVDFATQEVPIDPYFIGLWLGDGTQTIPQITNPEPEIADYLMQFSSTIGVRCIKIEDESKCLSFRFSTGRCNGKGKYNRNKITRILRELDVISNRHIPDVYKLNSREVRLQLLAGLIDTDGYVEPRTRSGAEISCKSKLLATDILFLCRSLGFAAYDNRGMKECVNTGAWGEYSRITISGDLSVVPTRVERKKFKVRKQVKSVLHTGISIEPIGMGFYYGFSLDESDGLFLLGDFTVTHNSTIIKAINDNLRGNAILMCPTGKAAARLKEATGYPASTIHSCLQWDGTRFHRQGSITQPIIIDEASMVDSWLMARLLEFQPPKVILVGDAAQLPPVGRGKPFHDLLTLRPEICHTLTKCWRASGAVHIAAQEIRAGRRPAKKMRSGGESWTMIGTGKHNQTIKQLEKWTRDGFFDPMQDIILAPKYGSKDDDGTDQGIHAINRAIRAIVNPSDDKWAVNDRVMCVKNFSELDMWNGDLGTIKDIDIDGKLEVQLDRTPDTTVWCGSQEQRELEHAYCLSVHKSQGSQFRRVFFVAWWAHHRMLERSLIYTAVTRAREGVLVCGELAAFYRGIGIAAEKKTIMPLLVKDQRFVAW